MPDIDVDFEDGRREEVINYVSQKYGTDHVAQIITFDRPRKSNLRRPSASMPCISYWVMVASEFVAFWSGISSVSGSREMTTPAACVDALRATNSSCFAKSMI